MCVRVCVCVCVCVCARARARVYVCVWPSHTRVGAGKRVERRMLMCTGVCEPQRVFVSVNCAWTCVLVVVGKGGVGVVPLPPIWACQWVSQRSLMEPEEPGLNYLFYSGLCPTSGSSPPLQSSDFTLSFSTFVQTAPCCPTMPSFHWRFGLPTDLLFCASNGLSIVFHSADVSSPFSFRMVTYSTLSLWFCASWWSHRFCLLDWYLACSVF